VPRLSDTRDFVDQFKKNSIGGTHTKDASTK